MKKFGAYLAERIKGSGYIDGGRDLFRTFENLRTHDLLASVSPEVFLGAYAWYPQTEFCYMRQGDFFFAGKGGYNAESHNHNDVGSFLLYYRNKPVLIDAGVGTYTRQTFSRERYTIWTMQSEYHSLPLINGVGQAAGAEYRSRNAAFDPGRMTFSLDIAGAYKKDARVKSWVRRYALDARQGKLNIQDVFELDDAQGHNEMIFMLAGKPDLSKPGVVVLSPEGENLRLSYDPKVFEAGVETVRQTDRRLSSVWGEELYRLRLKALKQVRRGSYTFTVGK